MTLPSRGNSAVKSWVVSVGQERGRNQPQKRAARGPHANVARIIWRRIWGTNGHFGVLFI